MRSPEKPDGNSEIEDSTEEEDEMAMQAAMREMVRNAEMDEMPKRRTTRNKALRTAKKMETSKSQMEDGTQTTKHPKKAKISKPETKKEESKDRWYSIFFKSFTWLGNQTTTQVPSQESSQSRATSPERDKLSKKDSPKKEVKENKPKIVTPGASKESLIHSERYVSNHKTISKYDIEEIQFQDSSLDDESISEEIQQKLLKIEEASKPKSWVRPKPMVIKPKLIASTTNSIQNKGKSETDYSSDEKHGYINILNAPFQRGLGYVIEKYEEKNSSPGNPDHKEEIPPYILESEYPSGKPLELRESQRTLTIKGHRHITTELGDHCHNEDRHDGVDKVARRRLIIACILCSSFMIIEIVGGVISNSLAIATDAAHLLTDLAAFLISLFAIYLSGRPASQRLNFGWHRAEVIGAMISVYLIWVITGILVYMAIQRLIKNDHDLDAKIMLITSALAILFNLIMACQLGHGHMHSHHGNVSGAKVTGSHHGIGSGRNSHTRLGLHIGDSVSTQFPVRAEQNINVRAALIHVIGDLFQSVGVFVAALIIFFKPEWAFMDSVCTFLFSILVLAVTIKILKDVLMVLMEGTPSYMDYDEVKRTFLSIEGVLHVHNLRIWALSLNKVALSAHLAIAKDADAQLILEEATTLIHKRHNFFETTIQIEEYSSGMLDCDQCADPLKKKDTPTTTAGMEEDAADGIVKKDPEKG